MRWAEIAAHESALGAVAHERLITPGVLLIGTTRRDGSARISGVEPLIMDGDLWLSMMPGSAKVSDLDRDPRLQVHSIITGPEAAIEIKLRGTARREHDQQVQERYARQVAEQLPWAPVVGDFALFAVDIDEVTYVGFAPESGDQHVVRWPQGEEYLRPATSATKLGARQPARRGLRSPRPQAAGPPRGGSVASDAGRGLGAAPSRWIGGGGGRRLRSSG